MDGELRLPDLLRESSKQRMDFLRNEVEMCSTLCDVAATEFSINNRDIAMRSVADAQKGYDTLVRFLSDPRHGGRLTPEQYSEIEQAVKRLHYRLKTLKR